MGSAERIDETDARILELLQRDGRESYAEVGQAVGMSGPSAHERVKKLEARRVITGYTATVDPVAAGFPILAFCWLTQAPGTIATDITPELAAVTEIEECHHIAGEADYLLKLRARSTTDLERILRRIQAVHHVFTTETDVVLSTTFERRPLGRADETAPAPGT